MSQLLPRYFHIGIPGTDSAVNYRAVAEGELLHMIAVPPIRQQNALRAKRFCSRNCMVYIKKHIVCHPGKCIPGRSSRTHIKTFSGLFQPAASLFKGMFLLVSPLQKQDVLRQIQLRSAETMQGVRPHHHLSSSGCQFSVEPGHIAAEYRPQRLPPALAKPKFKGFVQPHMYTL